ncbi:hypothetical protein ACIRU3_40470 [Streptomyces sp. NPDC101151]|uniref:hypothetical protein n=1 Tax=Streptomyces sp. NPDC101151 TaxID=3366115 RepID=UPI00380FBF30
MRTTYKAMTILAAAAAATGVLGLQTAQAVPTSKRSCVVQPQQSTTTADHYALTGVRAVYRTDAPQTNAFAFYTLPGEPQGCADGEFFVLDVLTGRVMPMTSGATSAQDWRDVAFTLPSGQRFVQVMHGDPGSPWDAAFVGSVSKLLS